MWNPNNYECKVVLHNKKEWTDQIYNELDALTDAVDFLKQLVYTTEVEANELKTFEGKVNFGETTLTNIVNQYGRKLNSVD